MCLQSCSLLPSPPERLQTWKPGSFRVQPIHPSPPHRCAGQPGGREHFLFYLKIFPEERTPRNRSPSASGTTQARLRWMLDDMGQMKGSFGSFSRCRASSALGSLPSIHGPSGGRADKMPERLASFRLTFSLLLVSHLERDRAASKPRPASRTVGHGRSPSLGLSPCV